MIIIALVMLSCGGPTDYRNDAISSMPMSGGSFEETKADVLNEPQQRIIREGYLSLESSDIAMTTDFVREQVAVYGGTISSEGAYDEDMRTSRHMVIRVPAANFDALVSALEKHAKKVVNKNISQRDVGEEFVDVEARLATKRELEARYRELLKQARNVQDMLSIERELANVRAEIESMTGRLRYLSDKAALSTLNLDFFQTYSPASRFAAKLTSSLVNGWYAFLGFMVWLAGLWPFLLLIMLLAMAYMRRVRRRKSQQRKSQVQ